MKIILKIMKFLLTTKRKSNIIKIQTKKERNEKWKL